MGTISDGSLIWQFTDALNLAAIAPEAVTAAWVSRETPVGMSTPRKPCLVTSRSKWPAAVKVGSKSRYLPPALPLAGQTNEPVAGGAVASGVPAAFASDFGEVARAASRWARTAASASSGLAERVSGAASRPADAVGARACGAGSWGAPGSSKLVIGSLLKSSTLRW